MLPRTPQNRTMKSPFGNSGFGKRRLPRFASSNRITWEHGITANNLFRKPARSRAMRTPGAIDSGVYPNLLLTTFRLSERYRAQPRGGAMISDTEYARAVAEFVRRKGVTRCPTVC